MRMLKSSGSRKDRTKFLDFEPYNLYAQIPIRHAIMGVPD